MSSKPKKQDYQASEAEKTSASIAKADKDYFNTKYKPLMVNMAEEARATEFDRIGRGISQADTMQALTGGGPVFQYSTSVDNAADLASAAVGNLLDASIQGQNISRDRQLNLLAGARGQQMDAASGLAQAARIGTSKELAFAKAKQATRLGNIKNMSRFAAKMGQNKSENEALLSSDETKDAGTSGLGGYFVEPRRFG
jgi:hypothetical protein|tara:strand:+ start:635 stop:1228 length:594 start_codon:yes stop_codon:yes gene_type:complete